MFQPGTAIFIANNTYADSVSIHCNRCEAAGTGLMSIMLNGETLMIHHAEHNN